MVNVSNIANTVTDMSYCFYHCTSLVEAPAIPSNVSDVEYCFCNCTSLAKAPDLPPSVTKLTSCFSGCKALVNPPNIYASAASWDRCFYGCSSLEKPPVIPSGVTNLSSCFIRCEALTEAPAIPDGVTTMADTFYGCVNLTKVPELPDSVTSMSWAFYGCSSLVDAPSIPPNVTNVGTCFYGCKSLTGLVHVSSTPTTYSTMFSNTSKDIYIVLDGSASASVWRTVANSYSNVYLFDDFTPSMDLSVSSLRVIEDGSERRFPAGLYAMVDIEVTMLIANNSLKYIGLMVDGNGYNKEWTEISHTDAGGYRTYKLRTWNLVPDKETTIQAFATDKLGHRSEIASFLMPPAEILLDILSGDIGQGLSLGRIATEDGVHVSIQTYLSDQVLIGDDLVIPYIIRSSWSESSDESTLPITPCAVFSLSDNELYYCDGQ